jgi:uncharacterized membrane protein
MNTNDVTTANYRPLIAAAMLLGIGMGGFLDGIVFHQILQTHNMLSAVIPKNSIVNLEVNMVWDGLFHAFTWLITLLGVVMLWRVGKRPEVPRSTRCFTGSLLLGWGLFNLVEGTFNHHILHLHHVVERLGVSAYDYGFLASGVLLCLAGWGLIRGARKRDAEPAASAGMLHRPA